MGHVTGCQFRPCDWLPDVSRKCGEICTEFCSALQPSSIPGLATPLTYMYFLYLSLSSVILVDSSTGSPVHDRHVLMLSIQAVRGHGRSLVFRFGG